MKLMLLRYHSRYTNFINSLINEYNIDDYVFSSDVTFLNEENNKKNVFKDKIWPESHEIIIKAVPDKIADKLFDTIVSFKKENNITDKLKIVLVPLLQYG